MSMWIPADEGDLITKLKSGVKNIGDHFSPVLYASDDHEFYVKIASCLGYTLTKSQDDNNGFSYGIFKKKIFERPKLSIVK